MARRSGPVALVVASILVLAIPVVMMAVSPHRDRGASNVQIQFAAGDKQAPAAQSQGKVGTSTAGTAQPATGRNGGAGAGSAPGRRGGGTGSTKSGRAGGGSSVQGTSAAGGSPSDTYLRKPARAPVQGGGDSVMIGDPNPSSPFPVPATSGLPVPVPSVSVPAINLHTVPKPHKFVLSKWIARCD